MEKLAHTKTGFTLIELLVYVSIITVAITVFAAFVADVTKNAARSKVVKEVQSNTQFIMDRITNDIRHAQTLGTVTSNSLGLTMSAGQTVTYAFDSASSTATYQQNSGTAVVISSSTVRVASLSFIKTSNAITINLYVTKANTTTDCLSTPPPWPCTSLSSTVVLHSSLYTNP